MTDSPELDEFRRRIEELAGNKLIGRLLKRGEVHYGLRSTVLTSQLKTDRWHAFLADPTVADAICDRVLHGAHKIALAGPSRRKTTQESTKD